MDRDAIRRARWRRRGAWMWPAYMVVLVAEVLVLALLPPWGTEGVDLVPALLVGGFLNLFVVAVLAPLGGRLLRLRRRGLPRAVATDQAGVALLVALLVGLVVGGIAHRPSVVDEARDFRAQSLAVRDYVLSAAPGEYHPGLAAADSLRLTDESYRTCVPGRDPKRWLCLYVDTDVSPPRVRVDSSREPNTVFNAPGGFR